MPKFEGWMAPARRVTVWRFRALDLPDKPPMMVLWPAHGVQPRDMSWGYVETPSGRVHIQDGDVIFEFGDGLCTVVHRRDRE